jgi:hypothetical protein
VKRDSDTGAYTLRDELGEIYGRQVPINHLKVLNTRRVSAVDRNLYLLDSIVDRRGDQPSKYEYLCRWTNFGPEADTWEPATNISNKELVRAFNQQRDAELAKQTSKSTAR